MVTSSWRISSYVTWITLSNSSILETLPESSPLLPPLSLSLTHTRKDAFLPLTVYRPCPQHTLPLSHCLLLILLFPILQLFLLPFLLLPPLFHLFNSPLKAHNLVSFALSLSHSLFFPPSPSTPLSLTSLLLLFHLLSSHQPLPLTPSLSLSL